MTITRGFPDWAYPFSMFAGRVRKVLASQFVGVGDTDDVVSITGKGQVLGGFLKCSGVLGAVGGSQYILTIDDTLIWDLDIIEYYDLGLTHDTAAPLYLQMHDAVDHVYSLGIMSWMSFESSLLIQLKNDAAVEILGLQFIAYSLFQA